MGINSRSKKGGMIMLFEKKSIYSIDKTIMRVKDELQKVSFGVLWEINFKDKLKEKGLNYDYNYWVLEVCNPPKAQAILTVNQHAGYFLPCKIVVYETKDGVIAGIAKPTEIINLVTDDENVKGMASEVEKDLIGAINKALI